MSREYWVRKIQISSPFAAIYDIVYWPKKGGNIEWITEYLAGNIAYLQAVMPYEVQKFFDNEVY